VDISIIVLTWNRPHLVRACLQHMRRAIAASGLACELWVVDNGSTAGDPEVLKAEFPEAKLIRSPSNVGYSRANNMALRRASGRYCILVNNDILVPDHALRALVEFMDSHPRIGVLGANLVDVEGNQQHSSGDILTPLSALADELHICTLLRRWRSLARETSFAPRASATHYQVGYVSGAFFMIRRATIDEIGLLDERFRIYSEEVDWCARAHTAGWEVAILSDLRVVHYHAATTRANEAAFKLVFTESRGQFLEKHYGHGAAAAHRAAVALGAIPVLLRWLFTLRPSAKRTRRMETAICCLRWALGMEKARLPRSD